MRRYLLIVALALSTASPASAQAFLKGLARQAAEGVARDLVNSAVNRAMAGPQAAPQDVAPAEETPSDDGQAAPAPAAPAKKKKALQTYVSDIPKPADAKEKKTAFDDFGRYRCSDCEGGYGYDSWGKLILNVGGYKEWEEKVGALGLGEFISWKGHSAKGELIVAAETEISGFPCKQITYRLTKADTQATAEREGLFCYGLENSYATKPRWTEVY